MDKIGFSWYPHFQRLLLLYYLLTRSIGCKDKLCGLFLRAKGCHGAWQTKPFPAASTSRRSRVAMQSQLEVGRSVQGTRNREVVQCFEGVWFHLAANRRRCFRAFLRDH